MFGAHSPQPFMRRSSRKQFHSSFDHPRSLITKDSRVKISSIPAHALFAATLLFAVAADAAPRGDSDGNGKLSLSELQTRTLARLMKADTSGDNKVSLEEWLARPAASKFKGDPSAIFKLRDTNGDGFLDASESEVMTKRRFDLLDANRDGAITDEEWVARRTKGARNGGGGAAMHEEQSASDLTRN
jgi:hypothetical protein